MLHFPVNKTAPKELSYNNETINSETDSQPNKFSFRKLNVFIKNTALIN